MGALFEREPSLEECLLNGGAASQFAIEGAREGAGIAIIDTETHAQRVGDALLYQGCGQIVERGRSGGGANTGIEGDEKGGVSQAPEQLLCGHLVQFSGVLLEAEQRFPFLLA